MPFIETALLGSEGAPVLPPNSGISHCAAIRYRIVGVGNLIATLYSADDIYSQVLPTVAMETARAGVVQNLANFSQERMLLRLETTAINEVFKINRITFFVKPLWTSLPG